MSAAAPRALPLLLFNGECAVCRAIAGWAQRRSERDPRGSQLRQQPIGDDPQVLRELNPSLDIWDAYGIVHVLMPDGSMKTGGEAVAEVLRDLPGTRLLAPLFALRLGGLRPFQLALDAGYTVLAEVRPILGCESCGSTNVVVRSIARVLGAVHFPRATGRPRARDVPKDERRPV